MKSNRWLWRFSGTVAALATILFVIGLVYAIRTVLYPGAASPVTRETPVYSSDESAAPSSAAGSDQLAALPKINILAIGDSLTRGIGDNTGKGYVERVKEGLGESLDKDVYVWNLAISGAKTEDLLKQLDDENDRLPEYVKDANVILLTIGGNDLFQIGVSEESLSQVFNDPLSVDLDTASLEEKMPEALDRLEQILTTLSEANPQATILYVMFYHPFLEYDPDRLGALAIQSWLGQAFGIANQFDNVKVVPTYDMFEQVPAKYLYSDHFHPNSDGYERIAVRVLQALN